MKSALIPFAIHKPTSRWVDVTQVQRGLNCDCICPSCFGDLIAKQGDNQEWHFAHRQTETECEERFSFAESLYGLTMQLLNQLNSLTVPYASLFESRILATQAIELNIDFDGYAVDFVVHTEDTQIAILLTHSMRPFRGELLTLIPDIYPILEIQLDEYHYEFRSSTPDQYRQLLLELLSESLTAKRWRRIPEKCKFAGREQFTYHCMGCNKRWQSHAHAHMCETCQSPLLSLREPLS